MIKVNLLFVKRKKKAKPIPTFIIATVLVTIVTALVMAFLIFTFTSRLASKKNQHKANENKIADLKAKIKEVENFEKLNKTIREKNTVIEQLRKNQSAPVKLLDEISKLLPPGVWLNTVSVSGYDITIDGYAFSNPDIVAYVDNMKNSQILTEVYLQESKSMTIENTPVYMFKLTFTIKV
jgi:type IV pilus assembly protein PilN